MTGLDKRDSNRFRVETLKNPGDNIDQHKLMAKVTLSAQHTEEICHILQYLNRSIVIQDKYGRDLVVRYTDYEAVKLSQEGLLKESEEHEV